MSREYEGLDKMLSVRMVQADHDRLHAVAESLGQRPQVTARAAIRLGLSLLERDPGAFVSEAARERGPAKVKATASRRVKE